MTPKNDFEREVIEFMARIDEHMNNQSARCDSHAGRMTAHECRTTALEASRDYAKGVLKAVAVGVPALGSVAWFIFEIGKFLKGVK